jgi:hypothetical protein
MEIVLYVYCIITNFFIGKAEKLVVAFSLIGEFDPDKHGNGIIRKP